MYSKRKRMLPEKICKTVQQYNREPIPEADMDKLLEIARDYRDVKNHIYTRYGGISGLSKIYPGYTVQNDKGKPTNSEFIAIIADKLRIERRAS